MQAALADPAPTVLAGEGAAAALLAMAPAGELAVLHDPAVTPFVERLRRGGRPLALRAVTRPPSLQDVRATGAWLAERDPAAVLAVGGGRVIDLAKLASTAGRSEASVQHLRRLARRAGWARLPAGLPARPPVLAVPTTLGTGAEVSGVAVVTDGAERTLVSLPQARPAHAALDPAATATLPLRLVREGALEALLRVAGPEVATPSTLRMAGAEARALAGQLAAALEECAARGAADDDLRLYIAQLSGATHRGWALAGRSAHPSPLWFLATELSAVLSVTKVAASALLLPAWLARAARGARGWGDPQRLAGIWEAIAGAPARGDLAEEARALLARWGVAPDVGSVAPGAAEATAQRAVRRWGGRLPMLGSFSAQELCGLVEDALGGGAPALAA
jgi:NADP-dependent alcohol dehydrogenase